MEEFLALHQPGHHSRSPNPRKSLPPGRQDKNGDNTGRGGGKQPGVWGESQSRGVLEVGQSCGKGNDRGSTEKDICVAERPKYQPAPNEAVQVHLLS